MLAAAIIERVTENGSGSSSGGFFNWVGFIANAVVIVALVLVTWKWLQWRDWSPVRHPSLRKALASLQPRGPLEVSYFLPKRIYHQRTFDGAPMKEGTAHSLTIGVGTYDIPIKIKAHTELTLEQLRVALHDSDWVGERPSHRGTVPSRFAAHWTPDFRGRPRYVDWNGEVRSADELMGFPRYLAKGDHIIVTTRVRSDDDGDGTIAVLALARGTFTRSKTVRLPLRVNARKDEVPYLRVVPEPEVTLTTERLPGLSSDNFVVTVGIKNERPLPIKDATMNLRVPNWVAEFVPCNQAGEPLPHPEGVLLTSSEQLVDAQGRAVGTGIKYWAQTDMTFPGQIATLLYFRGHPWSGVLPVRLTIVSPNMDEGVEITETFE